MAFASNSFLLVITFLILPSTTSTTFSNFTIAPNSVACLYKLFARSKPDILKQPG